MFFNLLDKLYLNAYLRSNDSLGGVWRFGVNAQITLT